MKTNGIFNSLLLSMALTVSCATASTTPMEKNVPVSRDLTERNIVADIDSLWQKEFSTAQEIIANFESIRHTAEGNSIMQLKNLCHYIWHSGEYINRCRGKNSDITELPEHVKEIDLDNKEVCSFMAEHDAARFADHYFMLLFMKQGFSFDDSRDGITATVHYHIRALNSNDYRKMKEVFSCGNDMLHTAYLEKLKFPFRNSGCSEEFYAIRPIIEKNVKESVLKSEIISLFDAYKHLMPGNEAPTPELKDINGNTHTFAEFRGKVLVIDVWATWCSSCLKGFKAYKELSDKYNGNQEIEFITVSVDRKDVFDNVVATIERRGLGTFLNLVTDCDLQSQFETDYMISGIPRYIVIDKDGNIVTAYAPSASGDLEKVIEKALDK